MRTFVFAVMASALALCACGPVECTGAACTNLAEGKACKSAAVCASGLVCFPVAPNGALGECRKPCSVTTGCTTGFNCFDPGAGVAPACVPKPGGSETWKLTVQNLSVPARKPDTTYWDGTSTDVPDPFVCFGNIAGATLCTTEQHGYSGSWKTTPFTTLVTTDALYQASISVFDSDAVFDFGGCEGPCTELSGWAKEVIYAKAFDLRPQWSHQPQVWTLTDTNGFQLEVHLDASP